MIAKGLRRAHRTNPGPSADDQNVPVTAPRNYHARAEQGSWLPASARRRNRWLAIGSQAPAGGL